MPFPNTSLIDDFNRADGAVGSGWSGPSWGEPNGFVVSANQMTGAGNFSAMVRTTTVGPDCEVYCTVPVLEGSSKSIRLLARFSAATGGSPNGYTLRIQDHGTIWTIYRVTAGSEISLGTVTAHATSPGDSIGFELIGSTLSAYYKSGAGAWVLCGSVTDATYGVAGFIGMDLPDTTVRIDNFSGGTLSSTVLKSGSDSGLGDDASLLNGGKIVTEIAVGFDTAAFFGSTLPPPIRTSFMHVIRSNRRKKRLGVLTQLRPPVVVLAPGTAPTSNEFGSGVDASTLKAVYTLADNPTSVDTSRISQVAQETAIAVDSSSVTSPGTLDSGSGNEVGLISLLLSDNGAGNETGVQKFSVSASDAGTGAETASNTAAQITGTDTGSGVDASTLKASVISSNTAVGVESVSDRAVVIPDGPYFGLESANLLTANLKSSEDNASGNDVSVLVVKLTDTETGSGIENSKLIQPTQNDVGSSVENGLLTFQPFLSDSGSSTDGSSLTVTFVGNEFGISTDAFTIRYFIPVFDTGSATENQSRSATLGGSDSGTTLDAISNFSRVFTERGSIYEFSTLDAEKFGAPESAHGTEIASIRSRELGSGRRGKLKSAN